MNEVWWNCNDQIFVTYFVLSKVSFLIDSKCDNADDWWKLISERTLLFQDQAKITWNIIWQMKYYFFQDQ